MYFLKIQIQNEHHINVNNSCAKGNSVLEFHKQADIIYGGSNLLNSLIFILIDVQCPPYAWCFEKDDKLTLGKIKLV